jgi:2-oxoglutarate ferredoxin oxidoreductase subunit gamma
MNLKRIIIAGEGGQGIQVLAKILVASGFADSKQVSFLPNFGVEQRGGVSLAYIQMSDMGISFPKFDKADIVVLFAPRAIKRIERYLTKDTTLIFDNSLIETSDLAHLKVPKVAVPATMMASKNLIPRVFNIILLGAVVAEVPDLKPQKVEKEIERMLSEKIKKEPQLKHFNLKAFRSGYDIVTALKKETKWREKILRK